MRNGSINSRSKAHIEKPIYIVISTEMENASDRHLPGIIQSFNRSKRRLGQNGWINNPKSDGDGNGV